MRKQLVYKKMKIKHFLYAFLLISCGKNTSDSSVSSQVLKRQIEWTPISTAANSWVYNSPSETEKMISKSGIDFWSNPESKIRTYFRVEEVGGIYVGIRAKTIGHSTIKLSFGGRTEELKMSNSEFEDIYVATFKIDKPGYYFIELQGAGKSSEEFAEVSDILISGKATEGETYFVKEDVYWGRRGPSVHLNYEIPEGANDIEYFYNEMTIPEGNDVVGSYFMANGFAEGYFGIQVNSESERRILFSVWSPFKTDDPTSIPDDQKIILLKKGDDVVSNDFGDEGSGGQSRRVYNWKPDVTYKFLMKVQPSVNISTDYTSYFYSPETRKWELIASFRRPKTTTYLKRPHSFLENFITGMGDKTRKVFYKNQWLRDKEGKWFSVDRIKFTADATARKDSRLDYAGGVENNMFYLKNCGFFSERTSMDSFHSKSVNEQLPPEIDLQNLP